MDHPNINKIKAYYEDSKLIVIVSDLASKDLRQLLKVISFDNK